MRESRSSGFVSGLGAGGMKVELPYGDGAIAATLPAGTRRLSSAPEGALPPLADLDGAVRAALAAPRGLPRIRDLVKPGARVTIAFDDQTVGSFGPIRPVAHPGGAGRAGRGGGDALAGPAGLRERAAPNAAAGRARRLLDDRLADEFAGRLSCHDAEDPAQIADLGPTPVHGYPVEVSRLVTDADLTVYVNTTYIRASPAAGSPLRRAVDVEVIRVTHHPDGMSMSLERNRMHAVLDEMGHHLEQRLGRRIFKIDTLLADPFQAAQVLAGGVDETRRAALETQARRFPRGAPPPPSRATSSSTGYPTRARTRSGPR